MKYKKLFKFFSIFTFAALSPMTTFAASCFETFQKGSGGKVLFGDLLNYITCIISGSVIPLVFALATVTFIWGVVQYVINNDDEAKKAKGKTFMIWGVVALAVMVSVWGLVSILGNTFGITKGSTVIIPQLNTSK